MRVIAGILKGRRLKTPSGQNIRPTSERVREALFSILGERVVEATILDLCCGIGTIGLEALSRGANQVVFVDHEKKSLDLLQENLKRCGNPAETAIIHFDAWNITNHPQFHRHAPYDVIFADPPYQQHSVDKLVRSLGNDSILAQDGIIIVEHFWKTSIPQEIDTLQQVRQARYGDTLLTFFQYSSHSHANRRLSGNV